MTRRYLVRYLGESDVSWMARAMSWIKGMSETRRIVAINTADDYVELIVT